MSYSFRIPVEDEYVTLLGRATYNFAYLEWGIVWLAETLELGFINTVGSLTAGQISKQFINMVSKLDVAEDNYSRLVKVSEDFDALVIERNALIHGNPYTAEGGEQRLGYNGKSGQKDWTKEKIVSLALAFESLSIEANDLLHGGRLQKYNQEK